MGLHDPPPTSLPKRAQPDAVLASVRVMAHDPSSLAGHRLERAVGMPELICQLHHAPAVRLRADIVVLIEV